MQQELISVQEAGQLIAEGRTLLVAGDGPLLEQLPEGKWIGGTIPYFICSDEGGLSTRERVFVSDISDIAESVEIKKYDADGLGSVYTDAGVGGFSFIIIPCSSKAHTSFALNAPNYENFASQPLVGWISGVMLEELGRVKPKVFDGSTGASYEEEALVMHIELIAGKSIGVGTINLFEQGDGDVLTFKEDTFATKTVMVNGRERNFAEYIFEMNIDTQLPLVADFYSAAINTSFQYVTIEDGVSFYAPVFSGFKYKHAKVVDDYAEAFNNQLMENNVAGENVFFSCNCILNYYHSELEGRNTDPFVGPITYGEIAYQLLNQTLLYIEIHDN